MTAQSLTQTDIDALDALINGSTPDVVGYYEYLDYLGYRYATLAKGVVLADTSAGAANDNYFASSQRSVA